MSSCPIYGCGHRRCSCCKYSYNNNNNHNNYAQSSNQQHAAPLPKGSSFSNASSSYYTQRPERPERPKILRWICCRCGGDNSYKTDQGCATCCNHWRDDNCTLYDANAR
ncbi:hypothetical protein COCHEDRAFT_1019998 [Bipolaris maydis C5]|uniref:Uncharacterized protein n=2 Tax=Cochliobolus heterostrophus TaxID=5016 RepID=M2UNQ3_COCH5|nr:hypothetical protein COCHEDRAFT_1019998 [Bipolaris maydis C5]